LAYLIGLEGLALLRAWRGDFDDQFVAERLDEVRRLVADEALSGHPGVQVQTGATGAAYHYWAETYDGPGNELLDLDLPIIDAILDGLPTGSAVDTACGTGRLAARLARRGHRVLGVDRSPEMLRQARRSLPGLPFVRGDLTALPVADGSVDLVTNALALTHVTDLDAVLAEFARVLRPGGAAIISDVHPDVVFRGSVVKVLGLSEQPQLASCHPRGVGDYVRAAVAAGFRVRGCEEPPRSRSLPEPRAEPPRGPGAWRDWPWSLLDWVPDAARAAWDVPALMVWHLQLD
jgi:SAM-dependent methyltransferase